MNQLSEKRFKLNDKGSFILEDGEPLKPLGNVVHKLNEQQSTIQFLQDEIDELKKDIDIYEYEEKKHSEFARKLYDENEQLKKELKWKREEIKALIEESERDE